MLRIRASIAALVVMTCLSPLGRAAAQVPMGQTDLIPALGFEQADINSVLMLIADLGNVNIVPDGQVVGRVTMQLRRISWLDALDAVMSQMDLVSEPDTDTMRITGIPEDMQFIKILRRSDWVTRQQQELQQGQDLATSVPLNTEIVPLNHATALDIQQAILLLGSGDGSITVDNRTNSLIIQDYPESIDLLKQIIFELDVPVPQIRIEAKLLEVDTDQLNQLGLVWSINTGGDNPLIISGATDLSTTNTLAAILGFGNPGELSLSATITALEQSGVANVIATPSISVLDNVQGRIFMGEKVPLRQLDVAGNVTIALQDVGTELICTPHVVEGSRIILELLPKRESFRIDPSAGIIVTTQEASTTVNVRDGETAVIGGLKSELVQEAETGIPILMNIPIIGALFRYHTRQVQVRDLILFVTPHIERESAVIVP